MADEIAEQRAQFVEALVIEADIVEHRDLRAVERDRTVALVDLADEGVALADQRARERCVGRDEIGQDRRSVGVEKRVLESVFLGGRRPTKKNKNHRSAIIKITRQK